MVNTNFLYNYIIKPILFRTDPEWIHERVLSLLPLFRPGKPIIKSFYSIENTKFNQTIWGYDLPHPIGLAGGFDKNAVCTDLWDMFGFSFLEIGTVTPKPQPGNPKPRLFRYPHRQALINRMGFNNDGSEIIQQRLETRKNHPTSLMGVSLGKQFDTPADDIDRVIQDYTTVLERLYPYGDFFVVNVSSPNTENLRTLQEGNRLTRLLQAIVGKMEECSSHKPRKPLCVKLAPDLTDEQIHEAVDVILQIKLDGIIATNTTNQTGEMESGGLSGAPLRARSTEVIHLIAQKTKGTIPIIGCGGIFTAEHAIEKLQAGASLLQLYTGFVYQGPSVVKQILKGIKNYMEEKNISHISDI